MTYLLMTHAHVSIYIFDFNQQTQGYPTLLATFSKLPVLVLRVHEHVRVWTYSVFWWEESLMQCPGKTTQNVYRTPWMSWYLKSSSTEDLHFTKWFKFLIRWKQIYTGVGCGSLLLARPESFPLCSVVKNVQVIDRHKTTSAKNNTINQS